MRLLGSILALALGCAAAAAQPASADSAQAAAVVYGLVMAGTNPEHVVSQIGDANTATQIVAPGLQPAGIEQRGNGLQVLVERY